jgi:2-dehydropantoate 2-reductase
MMAIADISIIGLGGVGGYFGFKLSQRYLTDQEVNVTFIARQLTYETIKNKGLILLSPEHQNSISEPGILLQNVSDLSMADIVVICVKEYDLEEVCRGLKKKVADNTVILPLMNGVDIYERIRNIISKGIVLPACIYLISHIKEKGIVEHKGKPGKIILGKDPQHPQYTPERIIELFEKAAIHIAFKEDPFPDIWKKFIFIASFGLVSARYNKSIGQVNEDWDLHRKALLIMEEIGIIAEKKGIALPKDIIDLTFQKSTLFPYHASTSLQLDVQSKHRNELELFAGAIIDYGYKMGLPVPVTRRIYEEIKQVVSNR